MPTRWPSPPPSPLSPPPSCRLRGGAGPRFLRAAPGPSLLVVTLAPSRRSAFSSRSWRSLLAQHAVAEVVHRLASPWRSASSSVGRRQSAAAAGARPSTPCTRPTMRGPPTPAEREVGGGGTVVAATVVGSSWSWSRSCVAGRGRGGGRRGGGGHRRCTAWSSRPASTSAAGVSWPCPLPPRRPPARRRPRRPQWLPSPGAGAGTEHSPEPGWARRPSSDAGSTAAIAGDDPLLVGQLGRRRRPAGLADERGELGQLSAGVLGVDSAVEQPIEERRRRGRRGSFDTRGSSRAVTALRLATLGAEAVRAASRFSARCWSTRTAPGSGRSAWRPRRPTGRRRCAAARPRPGRG